jgi:8-oxo-dGTP diphosphatase
VSTRRRLDVVGAAIIEAGRCLVAERAADMSSPGKWEFPGGKRRPGETSIEALVRELNEELGVVAEVGSVLGRGQAESGDRVIALEVYAARIVAGEPEAREHAALRWVGRDELLTLDFTAADRPIVPRVAAVLDGSQS